MKDLGNEEESLNDSSSAGVTGILDESGSKIISATSTTKASSSITTTNTRNNISTIIRRKADVPSKFKVPIKTAHQSQPLFLLSMKNIIISKSAMQPHETCIVIITKHG